MAIATHAIALAAHRITFALAAFGMAVAAHAITLATLGYLSHRFALAALGMAVAAYAIALAAHGMPDYYVFNFEENPSNLKEALVSPDAIFWKEVVNDEMDALISNKFWILVELPPGYKTIGYKWVLRKKLKPDGTINKFKARLVAKGFKQKADLDFFDAFSSVTRITSIRLLIAIVAIHDLKIHQMDLKTTFLNGDLEEEIYMDQPKGFVVAGQKSKVCKLTRSLYGLKQAPKQCLAKFDSCMIENGYKSNECDKCIYSKS